MNTNGAVSNGSYQDDNYDSARLGSVIYLCVVGVCGIVANSLVIFVFWKYPKLRTAANLFILNLAVCDLMLSLLDNTFSIASTLHGKWLFGRAGCISYGFFHYFFICCTVSTLAAISVDRFFFITRPSQTRAVQIITRRKAFGILAIIYLYTVLFTFPPCAGWNTFMEEVIFYSGCYINYGDQRTSSIAYSVIAPFFLFLIPLTIMVYCYARIFLAVQRSTQRTIGRSLGAQTSVKKRYPVLKRTHIQTAKMIIVVIFFSMIVWVPYVVVSFIKAANVHVAPLVSHITVLVAKSCVIYNVLIYAILNRKLKAAILDAVFCGRQSISLVRSPSSGGTAHKNRISRILSETDVPSHVVEAQKNRLSALSIQQSIANESAQSQYADNISPPRSPKLRNGVLKSVEFKDEQRRDSAVEIVRNKDVEVSGSAADFADGRIDTPSGTYTRKKISDSSQEDTHATNGILLTESDDVASEKIVSSGETEINSMHLKNPPTDVDYRPGSTLAADTAFSSLVTDSVPQREHDVYSSRSAKNSRSQTISSPSKLYKKGNRPISGQQVTKCLSPDSSFQRASGADQESDISRGHSCEHSREGSVVHRSASSHRPKNPRSTNRTNAKYPPSRRKRYGHVNYGRRGGTIDPLKTSAQELLEIQNYWKRMSLCLDDIDLDDDTRKAEMV